MRFISDDDEGTAYYDDARASAEAAGEDDAPPTLRNCGSDERDDICFEDAIITW